MDADHQQFNNQAFVPYAINGNETTYIPNGKVDTLTDCKDDGYVKPFLGGENSKNHEYENPAEVAKRAGLNRAGSGPRSKKNEVYGESKRQRIQLPETPSTPVGRNDGAERSPLVVTTLKDHDKPNRKCNAKLFIFLIFIFLMSAAALALSLMNMLEKNDCQCSSSRGLQVAAVVNSDEGSNVNELNARIDKLQQQCENVKKQMEIQRQELERLNKSESFKPKLLKGDQGHPGPQGATGHKGLKGNPGPQGIQGTQGIQGPRGFGNVSRCSHKKLKSSGDVDSQNADATYIRVNYSEPKETKVLSVTCSSSKKKGAGVTYLNSSKQVNGQMKYTCDCAGASIYGPFTPAFTTKMIECVMHIWECPL